MITEDYVSFETAKLLKEKGFDEGCSFVVNTISKGVMPVSWPTNNSDIVDEKASFVALPTQQMAMKWLREVHKMYIEVCTDRAYNLKDLVFRPAIYDKELNCLWESDNFSTYEEAAEAAIRHCLENLI